MCSAPSLPYRLAQRSKTIEGFTDETLQDSIVATALGGNWVDGQALEMAIGDWFQAPHVALFPTGWAASHGVFRGLIRPHDHIVIDVIAHNCRQEGANAATKNVHPYRHLDPDHARKQLQRICSKDTQNSILLVTEGVFSMDADSRHLAQSNAPIEPRPRR